MLLAVEGLVADQAVLDLLDMCTEDRLDAAFAEQRPGPQLARGLKSLILEDHPVDPEVAELGLVGQVDQPRPVPNPGLAQFVIDVEDVLERGALAGTGPVTHPDHQGLLFAGGEPLDDVPQPGRRLEGVVSGADGDGVTVGAEARRGLEPKAWAGGVDEVVVAQSTGGACPALAGVLDVDRAAGIVDVTVRSDRDGLGLPEVDALAVVDGLQREDDVFLAELPDPDPDVGGDPIPPRVGRDDRDGVLLAQAATPEEPRQMQGGGVSGDPGTKNDDVGHSWFPSQWELMSTCTRGGIARGFGPLLHPHVRTFAPVPTGRCGEHFKCDWCNHD